MANVHIPLKYNSNRRDVVEFFHWTHPDGPVIIIIPDGYYRVVTGFSEAGDMASWPSDKFGFREVIDELKGSPARGYYCLIRKEKPDANLADEV